MKHFDHCQCPQCRSERPPQPACGYLMQQIVSHGKAVAHCRRFCLSVSPLPRVLMPPLRVSSICCAGAPSVVEDKPNACGETLFSIPLSVLICDCKGQTHTAQSAVTLPVRMSGAPCFSQEAALFAQAHVRLCQPNGCFEDPAQIAVCLDVCLQAYLLRPQAIYAPAPCAPVCPAPLPLYPQPCKPPRC